MDPKEFEILHDQYEKLKAGLKPEKMGTETESEWNFSPAKQLLDDMIRKIVDLGNKIGKGDQLYYRLLAMEGALHYQHAKLLVQLEKIENAREILQSTTASLRDHFSKPEVTFLGLRVLNHYSYLLTKCGDLDKSQQLLELAEEHYLKVKADKEAEFYSNDDLFAPSYKLKPSNDVREKLERLVTNNLQMLAFVYNKQGKMDKFATYHHEVLKRQLDMREGDATVWAMKTARLGYFFMTRNNFAQARHHLAAACYVLSQYENTLKTLETTDLVLSKWEELNHRYADIAKCWVKYGLFLFNASRLKLVTTFYGESSALVDSLWTNPLDRFIYGSGVRSESDARSGLWSCETEQLRSSAATTDLKNPEDGMREKSAVSSESTASLNPSSDIFDVIFRNKNPSTISIGILPTQIPGPSQDLGKPAPSKSEQEESPGEMGDFTFSNLDLSCFESCVSCSYIDNLQAARDLFLFTHSWLKKSKLFYTLKDHPMEYINVVLDLSELYRYLAFYEDDIENQYSVQKRRADTLETLSAVLKELRPQCYIAISIELLRELAEVHLELTGLNLRRLYLTHSEPSKDANKANGHCFNDLSEEALRKMRAVADAHLRLGKFSDYLGHGTLPDLSDLPDFEAGGSIQSEIHSAAMDSNLFEYYDNESERNALRDLKEKFTEATRLLEEETRRDPKEEPYRSKYKAKEILSEMAESLEKLLKESIGESEKLILAISVGVRIQIGVISFETEEVSAAEKTLVECYDRIPNHSDPKFILGSINVRNHMGIIWSGRSEVAKAKDWLEGAEKLYEDFRKKVPEEVPRTVSELFLEEDSTDAGIEELERSHTLTKFYLAQVHGSLKNLFKSAMYCHETLRRQLSMKEYDPIDWALNSATLSQFFMERTFFERARHHLAAASLVLKQYRASLETFKGSVEELEAKMEEFRHRSADVSRCWAKYGIFLLEHSKQASESEEEPEVTLEKDLEKLSFSDVDLCEFENEITATEVKNFEEARKVFIVTQKHINQAKEYYCLEYHASDHVQVVQDHSQLYKHLTAFEPDPQRRCQMLKRRIDLLEGVLKELNPRYYLHNCRQIWFELGESYHDMMQIKMEAVREAGEAVTPHAVAKINLLAEKSIENFNHFIDSVKDKKTNSLPEKLPEDLMKPTLIAHFYLGRLHYKIISHYKLKQLENTNISLNLYQYFVDYCENNESAKSVLAEELSVAKEMMVLLNKKIVQLAS